MITETEAVTKWCPFTWTQAHTVQWPQEPNCYPFPPQAIAPQFQKCTASACMAWRRAETPEFTRKANDAFQKYGTRLVADTGYCGLPSKPEPQP